MLSQITSRRGLFAVCARAGISQRSCGLATVAGTKEKKKRTFPTHKLLPELAEVCKVDQATRPEVLKRIWVYIKENDLQGKMVKTMIEPDAVLGKVTGTEPFKSTQLMGKFGAFLGDKIEK